MSTFRLYIYIAVIILISLLGIWGYTNHRLYIQAKEERDIERQNVNALETDNDTLRTKNKELVTTSIAMKQEVSEIENSNKAYLLREVESMNIKLKNVLNITSQIMKVSHVDSIYMRDTIYKDTSGLIREISTGTSKDKWFTNNYKYYPKGTFDISKNLLISNINYNDSALLVLSKYKIGKWKLFNIFSWRKEGQKASIKLTCPTANIYVKQITIEP